MAYSKFESAISRARALLQGRPRNSGNCSGRGFNLTKVIKMNQLDNNIVTAINPLMQEIRHNGKTYFTSQYFHKIYTAGSPNGGKYEQLPHFNRLIRSIEAYSRYLDRGHLVELEWSDVKNSGIPNLDPFKTLFKATSYNPIMLISATAQVALSHHLDSESEMDLSVDTNERAACSAYRYLVGLKVGKRQATEAKPMKTSKN